MRFLRGFKVIRGGALPSKRGDWDIGVYTLRYMGSLQPARMIRNGITLHSQYLKCGHPMHLFPFLVEVGQSVPVVFLYLLPVL